VKRLASCLWRDEHGVILSTEIVIIGSVLVIGLITGMTSLQQAVNGELQDLAGAIGSLDQSYCFAGQSATCRYSGCSKACIAGSSWRDCEDRCDEECGDIAAAGTELPAVPCEAVAYLRPCSASCNSGGCATGCRSCGNVGCTGPVVARCIDTGVPGVKVTEWPTASAVITGEPCDGPSDCDQYESKKSFINIPDRVWQN
jgi:hypothetical protein